MGQVSPAPQAVVQNCSPEPMAEKHEPPAGHCLSSWQGPQSERLTAM